MGRSRHWAVVAIGLLGACSDERLPRQADLYLNVDVVWGGPPASRAELGYAVRVRVEQLYQRFEAPTRCRPLPASTVLTINGQKVPLRYREDGCRVADFDLGPFLDAQAVSVEVTEDDVIVAVAQFDGLMPGTTARLASPADGRVRAGDEIVVVPPPMLAGTNLGPPTFYPLEATPWDPQGVFDPEAPRRLFDGIHARVPPFVGPALVFFSVDLPFDSWSLYQPAIDCEGFAFCDPGLIVGIGPLLVEGVP